MVKPLVERIDDAIGKFKRIVEIASVAKSSNSLPSSTYDQFIQCDDNFIGILEDVKGIINVRKVALGILEKLPDNPGRDPECVKYQDNEIPFWQARLFCLQAYLSNLWCIYDNLTEIAGRIILYDSNSSPKRGARLMEHFLEEKNNRVPASMETYLKQGYGWAAGFSYAIRNWVIHDGNSMDTVPLFKSNVPSSEPFMLFDDAVRKLDLSSTV